MKIPKKITVKGNVWKIKKLKQPVHEDGDECRGLADFSTRTITLKKGMDELEEIEIFLHEMIHAALAEAHLNPNSGLSAEVEEIVCDSIATVFASCFTLEVKDGKKPKDS